MSPAAAARTPVTSTRVHHVNFVVRDLEQAIASYREALDLESFEIFDHPSRGARVARTRIGESWLVLVCPYDPDSAPGQYLAQHGEGFFLLSVGDDNVAMHLERLGERGLPLIDEQLRQGISDWEIADIGELHGALIQLTQEPTA